MKLSSLKELMVLRIVQDHPAHGYALSEMLEASLGWSLGLTRATTYTVLQRLEKRGWLVSQQQRDGRYPEKHVYSLSPEGRAGYLKLLESTAKSGGLSLQPLAALLLQMDDLPARTRQESVAVLREERQSLLALVESFPPHEGAAGTALELMRKVIDLELEAIDHLT